MIYLFDNNERLIQIVRKTAILSAEQKLVLTDEYYVNDQLIVEMTALDDDLLAQVEFLAIADKEEQYKFNLYWLAKEETTDNVTTLYGTQSAIEELRKTIVKDKRPENRGARFVIDDLLQGTNWRASYVADTGTRSTNFYYVSVFEALKKVCDVWGLEMQFHAEIENNRIGARHIEFKQKIGKSEGARVVYGHNALSILKEVERLEIVTALIGRGKALEVSSAEENESGQAGYGRKLTFEDVVWRKAGGKPVDKPQGQNYVEIPEATAKYGVPIPNGTKRPKVGVVEIEEEDAERLLQRTYETLVEKCRPQATFKTTTLYLDGDIGDTVRVVRPDRHIDYDTRIFEITHDRLTGKPSHIKLGDRLIESNSKRESRLTSDTIKAMDEHLKPMIDEVIKSIPSANGYNRNWRTKERPPASEVKVNDNWLQPDPEHEGHTIHFVWDGEDWLEVMRTHKYAVAEKKIADLEEQAGKLQESIGDIDDLRKKINDTSVDNKLVTEIVGHDGKMKYSKNRLNLDLQPNELLTFEEGRLVIKHNGLGFIPGHTYTISFTMEELERPHSRINIQTATNATVTLTPQVNRRYPTKHGAVHSKVYHDTYLVTVQFAGKAPIVLTKQLQSDWSIRIDLHDLEPHIQQRIVGAKIETMITNNNAIYSYGYYGSLVDSVKIGEW
ncbi:phage tail protein [Aerococcaceae bacterium NML130460]|nr:phage tail protein [Aerococcaceae bacterium NML130460]